VPEDVSVVGFDDIPESAYLNPALTTIRQDFKAVGQRAIELVIATLDGSTLDVPLLAPKLIIRDSTATTQESA
jgi:DNA-binding LacI/PurR family transcriptional regulator